MECVRSVCMRRIAFIGILSATWLVIPQAGFSQNSANNAANVETEVIFVTPFGVTPTQITRPKGKFFLDVLNRTWDPAVSIAFQPAPSNKTKVDLTDIVDPDGFKRRRHSMGLVDLPSGDYQLVDASGNVLTQITIQ